MTPPEQAPPARPRRRKRALVWRAILAIAAFTLVGLLGVAYRIRRDNIRVQAAHFPVWPAPKRGDRILIFAPHCDDETLGLSGFMQRATRAGAAVHVVFMTNGDGFPYSARRHLRQWRLHPEDYVRFGLARQQEALSALAGSGVPAKNVTFLGYPDRGLAPLWITHWTPAHSYTSAFTGQSRSPYPNSRTPRAIHCGLSVLADVEAVIRAFRPTLVLATHPQEEHSDHWATYAFVTDALWELGAGSWGLGSGSPSPATRERGLGSEGRLGPSSLPHPPSPAEALYLIHRGDWPVPQGFRPQFDLPPPAGLLDLDTRWARFPLSSAEEGEKDHAIDRYASQMRVMARFLTSFIRTNELIGTRGSGPLATVPNGALDVETTAGWDRIPLGVRDPARDSVPVDVSGGGDIVALSATEDAHHLYIRLELRRRITRAVAYDIFWHALPDEPSGTRTLTLRPGQPPAPGVRAMAHGSVWEIAVPRPPGRAVFLGAQTRVRGYILDKTGWRILEPNVTRK